jgi:predicted unusual protein kinase regulating ubiquinone biosynthesis (AarF/ABC1/UbiB family)
MTCLATRTNELARSLRYRRTMKRRYERLWAEAGVRGQRVKARLKQIIKSASSDGKIDDVAERRDVQVAEANAIASSASQLRGGVAKIAQLRAYLEGSTGLVPEAQVILEKLWDHLPGDEPQAIRGVLRAELQHDPEEIFARFDAQPIAAASLGQVHAAQLKDGRHVAIKVQYPGVAEALRDDLEARDVLRELVGADLGEALTEEAIGALRDRLLAELDYQAEAESLRRFRSAFATDQAIVIPAVMTDLSTQRVLTMERLFGRSLPELARSGSLADRNGAATTIFRFAFLSPWRHRIINVDPNPGNYLILEGQKDAAMRVGFVDFGCTARLSDELAAVDRQLFLAMIHRDGEALRYAAHRSGLVERVSSFHSTVYRSWENTLSAPFLSREVTRLEPAWARELFDLTWKMAQMGKLALPGGALLLWRQRLGVLSVLAGLRPELPLRRLLADLLDDGENPLPLYDRYR